MAAPGARTGHRASRSFGGLEDLSAGGAAAPGCKADARGPMGGGGAAAHPAMSGALRSVSMGVGALRSGGGAEDDGAAAK